MEQAGYIPAFGLLVILPPAWIYLWTIMRRRRVLSRRLEETVAAGQPLFVQHGPDIRLRTRRRDRLDRVARILSMPVDLPLAHVLPRPIVFGFGLIAMAGVYRLALVLVSPGIALVVAAVAGFLSVRAIFAWELNRYRRKLLLQLPDTIQLVVSATRAGLPVSEAFRAIAREMASPTKEEFQRVENALAVGVPPERALVALHQRTGVPEYAIFAVTIGVQARSGGRLAETIQNLAETIRERLTVIGRANALASEGKTSAFIMGSLPFVAGAIMSVLRPESIHLLFYDPRGQRMLAFGIITLGVGIVVMRQLIASVAKE